MVEILVVKVNAVESDLAQVLTGTSQGRFLGPILFIIYTNDLPEAVKSEVYLFAGDTKILQQITSRDDAVNQQSDSPELWSKKWLFNFTLTNASFKPSTFYIMNTQR